MKKISEALEHIIDANPAYKVALMHRFLNISQFAKFIRPLIEVRTKKDIVSDSALIMALSRYQREQIGKVAPIESFSVTSLTVYTDLCIATYPKSHVLMENIGKIYALVQKGHGYMALGQGTDEITMIVSIAILENIKKIIRDKPVHIENEISALGVKFDEKYCEDPGMLHYLIQQVSIQGINISEISSTRTEVIMYVDQKDIRLLFDTIHLQFYGR